VLINDMKFYEVQNQMVLNGHLYNPLFTMANDKWFTGKLSPEQQKIIAEEADLVARTHDGFSQQANIEGEAKLKAKGMTIYKPSPEELAMFRKLAQPAGTAYIREKVGEDWVGKALKAAAESEKKVGDRADAIIQEHIRMANDLYQKIQ